MARLSLNDGMGNTDRQLARRTTEEEDMAYFERQYQARVQCSLMENLNGTTLLTTSECTR